VLCNTILELVSYVWNTQCCSRTDPATEISESACFRRGAPHLHTSGARICGRYVHIASNCSRKRSVASEIKYILYFTVMTKTMPCERTQERRKEFRYFNKKLNMNSFFLCLQMISHELQISQHCLLVSIAATCCGCCFKRSLCSKNFFREYMKRIIVPFVVRNVRVQAFFTKFRTP